MNEFGFFCNLISKLAGNCININTFYKIISETCIKNLQILKSSRFCLLSTNNSPSMEISCQSSKNLKILTDGKSYIVSQDRIIWLWIFFLIILLWITAVFAIFLCHLFDILHYLFLFNWVGFQRMLLPNKVTFSNA